MNRYLNIKSLKEAKTELEKIGVSSQGVKVMAPRLLNCSIKLENVKIGAANILKQEMLSIGGDAAVARGVVNGKKPTSDVILLGNVSEIQKLILKLNHQDIFDLPKIKKDLQKIVKQISTENCFEFQLPGNNRKLVLAPTKIMGILNVTPDSFSDGGQFINVEKAVNRALEMEEEGANIIDIGGESSRPGAEPVNEKMELKRVIPVIQGIRKKSDIAISIDTYKAKTAKEAITHGADIINDISGIRFDNNMIELLKQNPQIPVIIMHMQGNPGNMQKKPYYNDVIKEITDFFQERIEFLKNHGISENRIIIDPGIGFGKRHTDNLMILNRINEFNSLGRPLLLGASRKSFIGRIYKSSPKERLEGTLATTSIAFLNNIPIVRVHDIKSNFNLIKTLNAINTKK